MRKIIKGTVLCVLTACMLFSVCTPATATGVGESTHGEFIYADGQVLKYKGETYVLKGMAFSNDAGTESRSTPPANCHDEQSYAELANLGFNSVRFYLSYKFFEDDASPYTYKQSGWDWLDQNIAWAKNHGMRLVLNMHTPQGGYQSLGKGWALWEGEDSASNQARLTALWAEIAERYADEPTVVGYGLINEPIVPWNGSAEAALEMYQTLMNNIVEEIRRVDTNHVIFAERVIGAYEYDASHNVTAKHGDLNASNNFVLITDSESNVAYELHTYAPSSVTHSGQSWNGTVGKYADYPNPLKNFYGAWGETASVSGITKSQYLSNSSSWTQISSTKTKVSQSGLQGVVTLYPSSSGTTYFDDITITEYDTDGSTVLASYTYDFDTNTVFGTWRATQAYSASSGRTGGCMTATLTQDGGKIYDDFDYLYIESGHYYQISGYAKGSGSVKLEIAFQTVSSTAPRTKQTLADYMAAELAFGTDNNVPMYVGEFGTGVPSFENGLGGEQWVADMIDILTEYNVSFSYHTYHEENFGLWQNNVTQKRANCNEVLANMFRSTLAEVSYVGYQASAVSGGKYNVRFLAVVNSTEHQNVGFDIKVASYAKAWDKNTTTVYTSVTGSSAEGSYTYKAEDFGGEYFYSMTLLDVPESGVKCFEVTPYYTDNGSKIYGATVKVIIGKGLLLEVGPENDGEGIIVPW